MAGIANTEQAEYWGAAQSWIDCRNMLDALLQPVLDRLLDGAALQPGQAVLDIGCGTGASSMAAARSVGADGQVTGADISALMLDLALQRAGCAGLENVTYLKSDVQTYPFEAAAFDHVISRFGVMFFDDPVAAFRNVRAAMRPGARLTFVAWAGQAVNPWFAIPRQAAVDVLGAPPSARARANGVCRARICEGYPSGRGVRGGVDNRSCGAADTTGNPGSGRGTGHAYRSGATNHS